jgi:hypothetical protein
MTEGFERKQQLVQMLEEAHLSGDQDKITELKGDLANEFPGSPEGEQDT